jgi:hypothetical protein
LQFDTNKGRTDTKSPSATAYFQVSVYVILGETQTLCKYKHNNTCGKLVKPINCFMQIGVQNVNFVSISNKQKKGFVTLQIHKKHQKEKVGKYN